MLKAKGPSTIALGFDGRVSKLRRTFEDWAEGACNDQQRLLQGSVLCKPPSAKDVRFPVRKLAYSANLKEEYVGVLPVGRSRFKTRLRDNYSSGQDGSTHSTHYTHVPGRGLHRIHKLSKDDKQELTGVSVPTYPDTIAAAFPNGEPLFWQEAKDVQFYVELYKDLFVSTVFDLSPDHGSAAIVAMMLRLKYGAVCLSEAHTNFLDNLLDQAIWPVLVDSHDDKDFVKELTTYFGPLVEQGRRLVRDGEDQVEEDVEEDDEASQETLGAH